jgi:hypothetical protein
MAVKGDDAARNRSEKPVWRTPELRELGNLRTFVQTGHAYGKSGGPGDGSSDPGGEQMSMND